MIRKSIAILLLISCLIYNSSCQEGSRVSFRIDGVRDYFVTPAQKAVMNVFRDNNVPLTIAVVANHIGRDQQMTSFVKQAIDDANWQVEVANYGYNEETFPNFSYMEQVQILHESNDILMKTFDLKEVTTFVPPRNQFNEDTLEALRTLKFTHMSASTNTDQRPFPTSGQELFRFPAGASTSSWDNQIWYKGVTALQTWGEINNQIAVDGFAVVVVHPQSFSIVENDTYYTAEVNETMIQELDSLLQMIRTNEMVPLPLGRLNDDAPSTPVSETVSTSTTGNDGSTSGSSTGGSGKSNFNCNCVAFRLDGVQDFSLATHQKAVIETFLDQGLPLTVSIIGSFLEKDEEMITYLRQMVADHQSIFRIANHGWRFEDFTGFSHEDQFELMNTTNYWITELTGQTPRVFVPPLGTFNQDTLRAAKELGYTHLSSVIDRDPSPYNHEDPDIWRFPAGAATSDINNKVYFEGVIHNVTFAQIEEQIARDGFSVVMMHPQEFSESLGYKVNEVMMEQLGYLIQAVLNNGYNIVLLEDIDNHNKDDEETSTTGMYDTTTGSEDDENGTTTSSEDEDETQPTQFQPEDPEMAAGSTLFVSVATALILIYLATLFF